MYKKIAYLCALTISFFLFLSPAAMAGHCGCSENRDKIYHEIQKLDLTPEQKEKIENIKTKSHEALKAKREEMNASIISINNAYKDGSMTEPKIDEYSHKNMQIFGAIIKIDMMERFEVSKVLTDKQKEKLDMILDKLMNEHMKAHSGKCDKMHH